MNALQVQEVSKSYNDFKAMDGISFTIQKGSLFGILEPNGAGKTTTMRIKMNIIIQDTGQVEILREPFRQAVKNRIGYLPEERGLYPKMKLLAQLQVLGEMKGLSTGHSQKLAEEAPGCFGLTQWMKHKVQDLSKGMQQKVQFIGTIMHSPDLIILDEPFSGLDPINANS